MKPTLSLLCLLFATIHNLSYSQNTDTLKIKVTAPDNIKCMWADTLLSISEISTLKTQKNQWVIHITSAIPGAHIKFGRNSLPIRETSDIPLSSEKTFIVLKDSLSDSNFFLSKSFTITIMDANSTSILSKKILVSNQTTSSDTDSSKAIVTGSPILDAFALAADTINGDRKRKILKYYLFNHSNTYSENPFLNALSAELNAPDAQNSNTSFVSQALSAAGGLDVTTIADGLARFLVKRTKEELSLAFFDRFKKVLDDKKYADLKTLFPQTWSILQSIDEDIYDYQKYLQNLREAFKADIASLYRNLPGIIDNHPAFFSRHAEWAAALRSACYIAGELDNKTHPGDILANYPVSYLDSINRNYKGAVQTVQLISASLRDTAQNENAPYWVSIGKIRELVNNKKAFKIYLGLIYQEARYLYDSVHFQQWNLIQVLNRAGENYDKVNDIYSTYKRYILGFGDKTDAIKTLLTEQDNAQSDSAKAALYIRYFRSSVDMLDYSTGIADLPFIKENVLWADTLRNKLHKYFGISYATADLAANINGRNYSAAINNTIKIYQLVMAKPAQTAVDTQVDKQDMINQATSDFISTNSGITDEKKQQVLQTQLAKDLKNYNQSLPAKPPTNTYQDTTIKLYLAKLEGSTGKSLDSTTKAQIIKTLKDQLPKDSTELYNNDKSNISAIQSKLVYYGGFMAAIATAKTSDEVEATIETFALPTGSSRIKRRSAFNVSLNAYTGLYLGMEKINGVDEKYKLNSYGVTAPIGIAISLGHCRTSHNSGSSSLFLSLVDIGAVAAFRFTNDSTEKVPSIQLKDLVSPGVFYSLGIGGTPLSVNVGYQVGPLLRKVNLDDNKKYDKSYGRFSVSVCVDIPVLNFYTKKWKDR